MPTLEFIVSVDTASGVAALKNFDGAVNDSGNSAKKSSEQFKVAGLSLTDMNSAVSLAKQGLETLKKVWEFGKQGAENQRIAKSFEDTSASVGVSADAMAQALDKAARGTVDDEVFMQTATRNMALGVATSVQDNVAIMEMARAASVKFGGDTETAFAGISEAIGNLQTRQLKQYGIIIDAKKVNDEYAASIGKTADELTDAEQREALRNEVLKQSAKLVGDAGNVALTTSEKFKRFETQVGNVADGFKEFVADAVGPMLTDGQQMPIVFDESALAADRLAAANDVLANGTIRAKVAVYEMIPALKEQAAAESKLAQTTEEKAVRAAMSHIRTLEEFDGVAGAATDQLLDMADASDVSGAALDRWGASVAAGSAANRQAYVDTISTAIEYTKTAEKENEIKQKIADLDAAIAANGPTRTAVIANEKMTVEQRALTEAQLAAAIEHTQTIKRKDGEGDAEYNLRLQQASSNVASLTAKLGEHTAVLGGATKAQLDQRDALTAQLAEFQRTQEIERATQAFQTLTKAYQDGKLTYDEFTVRSSALNQVTGLYTDKALAAAQAQEGLLKALTAPGTTEWATALASNKDAVDGVASAMDTAGAKAGESAAKTGEAAKEVVTRSTNAKQTALDEMGNAVADTAKKSSAAISDAMLSMSNAATAARNAAKSATDSIKTDWGSVPSKVYTDYYVRKHGEIPDAGGSSSPATTPTRALGGPVDEGWWYLHDDEYVLSKAMREGRQAIPAEAAPLRPVVGGNVSYGGDTVIINDQAALGMYLNAKRLDQLQQIAGILG